MFFAATGPAGARLTGRDRSHLFDIGDVLGNRGRRDQILFTELRFDAPTVEVTFGAVALNASRRPGMAGVVIALGRFVDSEGIFAVGGRRDRSRQVVRHVVRHVVDDTPTEHTASRLSPHTRALRSRGQRT